MGTQVAPERAPAGLLRPVRARLGPGVVPAGVSAACGLLPFVAVAGPAALLHAPGEPDTAKVWGRVAAGAAGAPGRGRIARTGTHSGPLAREGPYARFRARRSRAHHRRITGTAAP